jgi:hypothetical protein
LDKGLTSRCPAGHGKGKRQGYKIKQSFILLPTGEDINLGQRKQGYQRSFDYQGVGILITRRQRLHSRYLVGNPCFLRTTLGLCKAQTLDNGQGARLAKSRRDLDYQGVRFTRLAYPY